MEPNELDLLPTDELVRLILSARDSRAQYALPKHDDGVTLDFEQYRFIELAHELARRTTALQAKIDGMIERPKVSVETEGGTWWYVVVDGTTVGAYSSESLATGYASKIRQALGMDDSTNTKEPQ